MEDQISGRRGGLERLGAWLHVVGLLLIAGWSIIAGAQGFVLQLMRAAGPAHPRLLIAIPFLFLAISTLGTICRTTGRRRSIRMLREARCLRCLRCRYPLGGLADFGVCPECGGSFRLDQIEDRWRQTYPEL